MEVLFVIGLTLIAMAAVGVFASILAFAIKVSDWVAYRTRKEWLSVTAYAAIVVGFSTAVVATLACFMN